MKKKIQKMNFTGKTIFIGLDVHMTTWHATMIYEEVKTSKSFKASAEEFHRYLTNSYPGAKYKVAYESGYTGYTAYEQLSDLGMDVIVVNPSDVPTTDKDSRTKTDKIDSKKLAMSLKGGLLRSIFVPSRIQQNDRFLIRRRRSARKDETRVKNRIKAFCAQQGINLRDDFPDNRSHWSKKFILWLRSIKIKYSAGQYALDSLLRDLNHYRGEILLLTKQIRALSKSQRYSRLYKILISVPGVGLITSMTYLTEIGGLERFETPDKLLSYIGLVPTEHSSGSKQSTGHMNKRQNKYLRSMTVEAAWVALRCDPVLAACYNHARERMPSQKAIIKVARKLVTKIYYIWSNDKIYEKGII